MLQEWRLVRIAMTLRNDVKPEEMTGVFDIRETRYIEEACFPLNALMNLMKGETIRFLREYTLE